MPDWQVLLQALAHAQGAELTEKDHVWLAVAGVLDLLVEVARGNEFALGEIGKFEHWTHEFIRSKIEEEDIDFEVVAGALIVSLPRGLVSDTEMYLDFLLKKTQPALPPAVLCALQRFPVYRARWKSLGMRDVGAIECIGARFNGDGGDDFDDEFYQFALEAQAGGHLWAVLFCLINCMAQAFFPGDRHFPSVVTQEYFAKAVEAFAIVVDFRVFTDAVRDLFVIFFALLIHAFSAEELPLIGFTLPYAGGNMANKFCVQVRECGPIAEEFCWKLLGTPNYLFGATNVPRDIFDRLANDRPLGVYYTQDYLIYGWRFATAFNLLDDPEFFLDWLRQFWDDAQEGEEMGFTVGLPIRKNFKSFELDGIRLFFRRFLALSSGCAFSLGTIRRIPGAMTFESPVNGFTLADLARFLQFAEGSKKARTSALAAMIFALNEQKGPLPIELITQIFLRVFQPLGEFLHLNRRTPLDYMHDQLAQRQDSLLRTARFDLQRAELERVDVETELGKQKGLVAELLKENEERDSLLAELQQERDERALRGEKRAASGEVENSPAMKAQRQDSLVVTARCDPQRAERVDVETELEQQKKLVARLLKEKEERDSLFAELLREKEERALRGEKRAVSGDDLNSRPRTVQVVVSYTPSQNQGPPVALSPNKLGLPPLRILDPTPPALEGGSPYSPVCHPVLTVGTGANLSDGSDSEEESDSSRSEEGSDGSDSEEESDGSRSGGESDGSRSGEESDSSDSEEESDEGDPDYKE